MAPHPGDDETDETDTALAIATAESGDGCERGETGEAGRSADDALVEALVAAVDRLAATANRQIAARRSTSVLESAVQELEADRSELARKLDAAEARAARLEAVNREVSAKLVAAMEKVRALIDTAGRR
jgi:hypothetical protein